MSKAMKKDVKEVFKWTEVLRKNLVETCLEAQARGNFTDSGFKSAEWSKIEDRCVLRHTLSPQYDDPNCSYDSRDEDRFTIDHFKL